jgi:membrane protein implicated in regulation of membrane protease activity
MITAIIVTAICSVVATLFIQSVWNEYKHRKDINKKFEEAERLIQITKIATEVVENKLKEIIKDNE